MVVNRATSHKHLHYQLDTHCRSTRNKLVTIRGDSEVKYLLQFSDSESTATQVLGLNTFYKCTFPPPSPNTTAENGTKASQWLSFHLGTHHIKPIHLQGDAPVGVANLNN